ncbi:MAG: 50S ribosomal protein L39e [Candidatus Anstonellales archaeon]
MSKKTPYKKSRLAHAMKTNRRIPVFVVAKTKRRIIQNKERRHWRRKKLNIKEK